MGQQPASESMERGLIGPRTVVRSTLTEDPAVDELRELLDPFVARTLRSAIRSLGQDLVAYGLLFAIVVLADSWWLQTGAGVGLGLVMTNLFMIGHDAAHGSFTDRSRLNRAIARIAFSLAFHPVSAWAYVHHEVHHRLTNDPVDDLVWRPLSVTEYRSLTSFGRWRQRSYRHTAGFGLYYFVELWSKELMGLAPTSEEPETLGRDRLGTVAALVGAGTVGWFGGGWWAAACMTVIPLGVLSWAIGFVVYFNHTHPMVPWLTYDSNDEWSSQVRCTVRLVYPTPLKQFLGNIMEHTAHHVHPGVPLANLRAAQEFLQDRVGADIVEQKWTPARHRSIVGACRLYDHERHVWLDFDGQPTAATMIASPIDLERFALDLTR